MHIYMPKRPCTRTHRARGLGEVLEAVGVHWGLLMALGSELHRSRKHCRFKCVYIFAAKCITYEFDVYVELEIQVRIRFGAVRAALRDLRCRDRG